MKRDRKLCLVKIEPNHKKRCKMCVDKLAMCAGEYVRQAIQLTKLIGDA